MTSAAVGNIDASLEAVEEIFAALLDISRLDTGAMKPEIASFRIDELLRQLEVEFAPLAREKGLRLEVHASVATIRSDRRLLRRLLQNLVSNAIKYTPKGRVLVGCRRRGASCGSKSTTPASASRRSKRQTIFGEFDRLDQGAKVARGLGLGLSIVERIARVLGHKIEVASTRARQRLALLGRGAAVPASPRKGCRRARSTRRRSPPARRHRGALPR